MKNLDALFKLISNDGNCSSVMGIMRGIFKGYDVDPHCDLIVISKMKGNDDVGREIYSHSFPVSELSTCHHHGDEFLINHLKKSLRDFEQFIKESEKKRIQEKHND